MDISGIINTASIRATSMEQSRQEVSLERFQDILERSMSSSSAAQEQERVQIREAAEMFEAYFLQMMFREMRRTTFNEDGLFPKSHAERIFTDMLDEEISNQAAASSNGFGLADMIYAQMTRHMDVRSN